MKKLTTKLRSIKGAALVEYGILVGLIAVLAIVAVLNLGGTVRDTFTQVSNALSTSLSSARNGSTTDVSFNTGASFSAEEEGAAADSDTVPNPDNNHNISFIPGPPG